MEGCQVLLVLLVEVASLPAQGLHDGLPLGEGAGHRTVQAVVTCQDGSHMYYRYKLNQLNN